MTSVNTFLVCLLPNWLASSLTCGKAAWYLWPLTLANCRLREQNLEIFWDTLRLTSLRQVNDQGCRCYQRLTSHSASKYVSIAGLS